MADKPKDEAKAVQVETGQKTVSEARAETKPCKPHTWKRIIEPKGFHNQRCTGCKAERRSNNLN